MSLAEIWRGDFGNEYTERQIDNTASRSAVWFGLLSKISALSSALEVGSNVGLNLKAINEIMGERPPRFIACEPNAYARLVLDELNICSHITSDTADKLSFADNAADLAFTSGVLIHVAPDKLEASMREIHRVAKKYIICGEYFAPKEEMIPYRGHTDALWRRDYGALYMDLFPKLKCIDVQFAWKRTTGLDNVTFWVFEK